MNKKALIMSLIAYYIFIVVPLNPVWAQELHLPSDSDRVPPLIEHQPSGKSVPSGKALSIEAVATDNVTVKEIVLYYRSINNVEYFSINMSPVGDDHYVANIPVEDVLMPGLEYYIQATDKSDNVALRGFSFSPLVVIVAPVILPITPIAEMPENVQESPEVQVPSPAEIELKTEANPQKAWYQNWVVWALVSGVVIAMVAGGNDGDKGGGGEAGAPSNGNINIGGPLP